MPGTAHPLTETVGIEITGCRPAELLTLDAAADTRSALDRHGVVIYRDLHISDDELVDFSRLLGTVVLQPTGEHNHPEIQTITMDPNKTNALLASYRQGNFHWHIDGATESIPQKATLLTAREIDPAGGDTEFATTYAAYSALSESEQRELDSLQVLHSFAQAQSLANPDATEPERASWDRVPTRVHPLVWTRRNGRKSMLLGATAQEIVGWPASKGRALLDKLLAWSTQPRFTLRQKWQKGDLVIWDNTGMLHRALHFEPTSVRLLHRTTLAGEESVQG
ncbi:Taurine dioxygenase, alpha-ketoglutarate-dependent [Mycobacterium rhizamassiliense]|jgi:alpha-ketoglutarate-dependent taurine dioxygenase|uniref:Taurine dioxygenase, alpha-ketoglutarate-dependent n=1 Tax=Mycobacterium rhizamassiliense TaxID=1841860 RepID=A0A2U3NTD2_9MYCO|nr:TauD/TfdA family dioxygenase [Mycobacterium rhizamassiliense]SPM34759.1 Taurine dioxygenase, alpha-ketoglutarate-dependent [Mycobacterium rhizamassiliense]